jgi:hypothetical protein
MNRNSNLRTLLFRSASPDSVEFAPVDISVPVVSFADSETVSEPSELLQTIDQLPTAGDLTEKQQIDEYTVNEAVITKLSLRQAALKLAIQKKQPGE